MKFTFRQLAYFIAAAEAGSITAASKRANISQPAISTAISHIERELNVQLFLRHHAQGLSLTPAGRALLRDAKQLLKQSDGLYSAAADIGHQLRGELSVGWFSTLAPIVMPELVQAFLKAFPETKIRSFESHQEGLVKSLRAAEIEVAITYDLQIGEDINFLPLATLPPYALFGAAHPLARERAVKLSQLARHAHEPRIFSCLVLQRPARTHYRMVVGQAGCGADHGSEWTGLYTGQCAAACRCGSRRPTRISRSFERRSAPRPYRRRHLEAIEENSPGRGIRASLPGTHFGKIHSRHGRCARGSPPEAALSVATGEVVRLMQARDWAGALQRIDRALAIDAQDRRFLMHRAQCLMALGRRAEAFAAAESAQRFAAADGAVSDAIGTLYSAGNDQKRALAAYDRAVALQPRNPRFLYNRAVSWGFSPAQRRTTTG
jgi:DNA-binding transcriptional LysR family regulator